VRRAGGVGAELLVDQDAAGVVRSALANRPREPLVDERLEFRDAPALVLGGVAGDAYQLLLERAAVVEGEQVEALAGAHRHNGSASSSEAMA
jgi:hypothetical protein